MIVRLIEGMCMSKFSQYVKNPYVAGAISGLIVGVIFVLATMVCNMHVANATPHNATIVITGKICNDNILGYNVSKIQTQNDGIFFVSSEECKAYHQNEICSIRYFHIEELPWHSDFSYNTTIGGSHQ